ncbi:MAG: GNAT family N-acetyltransferase [Candidatus Aenigmarchaeota archaeon]|nr:GNAT family N-acetyltransferase [Candidatus Aenigmarchaeota archaeon]
MKLRNAKLVDVKKIQDLENEYYGGFSVSLDILENWIEGLSENFFIAEENDGILGCIFFEYLNSVKSVPYVHKLVHDKNGKYGYVSEILIKDELKNTDLGQKLFDKMLEKCKNDGMKGVIWLTGPPEEIGHDMIENQLITKNDFKRIRRVKKWEATPNFFIDDHWIWIKELK